MPLVETEMLRLLPKQQKYKYNRRNCWLLSTPYQMGRCIIKKDKLSFFGEKNKENSEICTLKPLFYCSVSEFETFLRMPLFSLCRRSDPGKAGGR